MVHVTADLLNEIESIMREARAAIMDVYSRAFSVQEKADKSPLTAADTVAHGVITGRLAYQEPELPILFEEVVEDFRAENGPVNYWLVDPLDGTKEFIKRNGEFTVNIALIRHGRPALGVVYAPVLDVAYLAAAGGGAFKVVADGTCSPISVATIAEGSPWCVVGSRSRAGDSLIEVLRRLGPHELISMSSSLKFCLVAEGRADVYPRWGPTSLWDTASAQCVVEQAGGRVIRLSGEALSYADPSATLNPSFVVRSKSGMDWRALLAAPPALQG